MQGAYFLILITSILSSRLLPSFNMSDFSSFHNQNPLNTWQSRLNPGFDLLNNDQLLNLCGTQLDSEAPPSQFAQGQSAPASPNRLLQTLPASYDLRTAFPQCWSVSYIRNQGQCGSCWAFASMSSLSDRYCIKKSTSTVTANREFSMQDPLECCSKADCGSGPNAGCKGGYLTGGFAYALKYGVSTGENYGNTTMCKPYFLAPTAAPAAVPNCSTKCANTATYTTPYSQDLLKISGYTVLTGKTAALTMTNILNAIYLRGSVMAMMYVYMDFYTYSSGVYQQASTQLAGGHGVRVIGWGVSTVNGQAVNYWIVANSWGTSWGQNGFFWIIRGVNNCNIESSMIEGLIN